MADIPEEAIQAATTAITNLSCEHEGFCFECEARAALAAAAPFIAAQALIRERRRAVRLVRRTLVPRGCVPTKDAADLIDAIKGDLRV